MICRRGQSPEQSERLARGESSLSQKRMISEDEKLVRTFYEANLP